jgi:hypothetical protein
MEEKGNEGKGGKMRKRRERNVEKGERNKG